MGEGDQITSNLDQVVKILRNAEFGYEQFSLSVDHNNNNNNIQNL